MKKALALMTASAMALSLAACGGSSSTASSTASSASSTAESVVESAAGYFGNQGQHQVRLPCAHAADRVFYRH